MIRLRHKETGLYAYKPRSQGSWIELDTIGSTFKKKPGYNKWTSVYYNNKRTSFTWDDFEIVKVAKVINEGEEENKEVVWAKM